MSSYSTGDLKSPAELNNSGVNHHYFINPLQMLVLLVFLPEQKNQ
jgi:hypothetical protein